MQVESFEEIVFKNRNHDYGSYYLRQKYGRHMSIASLIALFIFGAAVSIPVIAGYYNHSRLASSDISVTAEMLKAPSEMPLTPPPPPPDLAEKIDHLKFVAPTVVDENVETDFGIQDELANRANPTPTVETEIQPTETAPEAIITEPVKPDIFTIVEEQPLFPGGDEARIKFLRNTLSYPEEAKQLGIQGIVFLTFVVETDGSISDIKLLRGIGGGCDEEAIRAVKTMPNWIPGKQRGNPVRVQFNLPVKFTLQ